MPFLRLKPSSACTAGECLMPRAMIIVCLAIASPLALAAQQLKGGVFSPAQGVLCDKKAQFCADAEGISLAYTKQYLGEKAQKAMQERIDSASKAGVAYDLTWFAFSNGVDCKTKLKRCTVSKHSETVDAAHTKALFGK
jgi:hypothetical protein